MSTYINPYTELPNPAPALPSRRISKLYDRLQLDMHRNDRWAKMAWDLRHVIGMQPFENLVAVGEELQSHMELLHNTYATDEDY